MISDAAAGCDRCCDSSKRLPCGTSGGAGVRWHPARRSATRPQVVVGRTCAPGRVTGAGADCAAGVGVACRCSGLMHGTSSFVATDVDCSSSGVAVSTLRRSPPVAPKLKPAKDPATSTTAATRSAALVLSVDRAMIGSPGTGSGMLETNTLPPLERRNPLASCTPIGRIVQVGHTQPLRQFPSGTDGRPRRISGTRASRERSSSRYAAVFPTKHKHPPDTSRDARRVVFG